MSLSPMPLIIPTPLQNNLPDVFQNINGGNNDFVGYHGSTGLIDVQQSAVDTLNGNVQQVFSNQFIQTCDDATLAQQEAIYGIVDTSGDDTFRRSRLLSLKAQIPPFTQPYLLSILEGLMGQGNVGVMCNPGNQDNYVLSGWSLGHWPSGSLNLPFVSPGYNLYISVPSSDANQYQQCAQMITMMMPCHMVLIYGDLFFNTVSAGFNAHQVSYIKINGLSSYVSTITTFSGTDPYGRIPICYSISALNIGSPGPQTLTSVQMMNSSLFPISGLMNTGLNITIPASSSINIMHLITVI